MVLQCVLPEPVIQTNKQTSKQTNKHTHTPTCKYLRTRTLTFYLAPYSIILSNRGCTHQKLIDIPWTSFTHTLDTNYPTADCPIPLQTLTRFKRVFMLFAISWTRSTSSFGSVSSFPLLFTHTHVLVFRYLQMQSPPPTHTPTPPPPHTHTHKQTKQTNKETNKETKKQTKISVIWG